MPDATFHFPPDFLWGAATASHQVEGHNTNNQWWAWEQLPGRIAQGHKSGRACDWWENAEADFDRALAMNLRTLRLSIEWSRVEVEPGKIDTSALDRYRHMLRGLRERGIEPMVTLHHFTDPMWLSESGGWTSPDVIAYFVRYVEQVLEALRDYATLWCTINEPNVYATSGYVLGSFPPGVRNPGTAATILRHMLRAHASAYRAIHNLQPEAQVGLAHNLRLFDPARPNRVMGSDPRDRAVAWIQDLWFNQTTLAALGGAFIAPGIRPTWWLPPLGFGPAFGMRKTLDWIGLNYYTRDRVMFDRRAADTGYGVQCRTEGAEPMDGGYGEVYPEGIIRAIKRLSRFGLPIHITENGIPDNDDSQRPRALMLHLHQIWRALQDNYPVMSYYHWTLVDNFEWAEGWTAPFGLVELDPETQTRRPRPSADLYAAVARGNAITPELLNAYTPELRQKLLPG
ncbi:MAG: glycoside hydrolase family 1 protein [Anaerolineae bacterium]|nr:glycoside hydrolase family 1 protein [Anaerolineae bacterium]